MIMWGAVIFFTSLVVCGTAVPTCDPARPGYYLCHETDPTQYYVCSWGRATLMNCPAGLHFDRHNTMCVYPGNADCSHVATPAAPADPQTVTCVPGEASHHCRPADPHHGVTCLANGTKVNVSCEVSQWYDNYFSNLTGGCISYSQADRTPCNPATWGDPACPPGHVGMLPHPHKCHFYIRCGAGGQEGRLGRPDRPYDECPYPKMFSILTNRCEDFWAVACYHRQEVKEPCDYRLSGVASKPPQRRRRTPAHAHPGPPCELYDPSCLNLADGYNPHPYMPHRYIKCLSERTMAVHQCPAGGQTWQQDQMRCVCPQGTELQQDSSGALRCVSVPI